MAEKLERLARRAGLPRDAMYFMDVGEEEIGCSAPVISHLLLVVLLQPPHGQAEVPAGSE